jgi:hypothetical protein
VREFAALSLVGVLCAVVGGAIFRAVESGTTLTRSIAFGCWIAAAVALVLSFVAGQKLIWRRTNLPVVDGWVFVSAATVLTAAGAIVDVIGS